MAQRFLQLADVAEELNISPRQALTLLQNGEIRGIQVGPKRIWRVEAAELEAYIQRMYVETEARMAERVAQPEEH
ncbi:helix-turn-helix domain-containing protein [Spongisporangium articulatum]|uniref:Helix-turn-helix domain-containing protein n=1 Tax=Spongisporangium articulatum TaxID=3362603 RepID=A0ABW8AM17_9ACTN